VRTLIACLGNIFLGDDGFGVEVARRLTARDLPEDVRVTDYGIRGMHLAYDLADSCDRTILVDAVSRGGEPGTVYVIQPDVRRPAGGAAAPAGGAAAPAGGAAAPAGEAAPAGAPLFDAHGMQPDMVLGMAGMLGASADRVLIVGCEPASLDEGMGLSSPVAAAVDEAVRVITGLVTGGRAQESGQDGGQDGGQDSSRRKR
jgi:hydrogenase maturation protease